MKTILRTKAKGRYFYYMYKWNYKSLSFDLRLRRYKFFTNYSLVIVNWGFKIYHSFNLIPLRWINCWLIFKSMKAIWLKEIWWNFIIYFNKFSCRIYQLHKSWSKKEFFKTSLIFTHNRKCETESRWHYEPALSLYACIFWR